MLVVKTDPLPVECVVRGISLVRMGGVQRQRRGLRDKTSQGLLESSKLEEPIFTPAPKQR